MILTPKDDFRQSPNAKGWQDLVAGTQFQSAATAAMMLMVDSVAGTAEAGLHLQGAKMFLRHLMTLAEEKIDTNKATMPQLQRT